MPVETRRRTLVETTTLNVPDDEGPLTKLKKSPKSPADTLRLKQEVTPTGSSNANSRPIKSDDSDLKDDKSWYEKRREENLRANAAFLAQLNISETKSSFSKSIKPQKTAKPSSTTTRGIKHKREYEPPVQREYSLRPRGVIKSYAVPNEADDLLSLPTTRRSMAPRRAPANPNKRGITSVSSTTEVSDWKRQETEPELKFEDNLVNKETCDLEALTARIGTAMNLSDHVDDRSLDEFVKECKQMTISDEHVCKVTPSRIFSLAIHPSGDQSPLIAAGDKNGFVGLWNVQQKSKNGKGDDGVCFFQPHTRPVNCTLFSPVDMSLFHTASYDGTVRKCDINKQVFSLVHQTALEDDIGMMYLSTVDRNTVAVCTTDGHVTYVDDRNHPQQQTTYKLYTDKCSKFKCISHHPIQKEYFITGSVQGKVQLWDSRYISSSNKKLSPLHEFTTSMGVLSSYFSPITGDKILACASGNEMTVYDSSDLTNVHKQKSFFHDNHTGRWISNFRAAWHPAREDCFVIGAMKHPRQIEMFDCSGKLLHNFNDNEETLNSITSLNVLHPSLPVLAGGNSSGKVYVYMSPQLHNSNNNNNGDDDDDDSESTEEVEFL